MEYSIIQKFKSRTEKEFIYDMLLARPLNGEYRSSWTEDHLHYTYCETVWSDGVKRYFLDVVSEESNEWIAPGVVWRFYLNDSERKILSETLAEKCEDPTQFSAESCDEYTI